MLNFADSSAATWGSGLTLTVSNWSGSATDQIFFGNSSSSLSPTQLSEISFIDPAGFATGSYGALLLGSGELVPVPEPSCVAVAAGLLGIAGWRERRRAAVARRAY